MRVALLVACLLVVLPVWAVAPDDPDILYPNPSNTPNWCATVGSGWCSAPYGGGTCTEGSQYCNDGNCNSTCTRSHNIKWNPTIWWESPANGDAADVWLDLQLRIVRDDGDGCGTDDFPAANSITGVEYYWGTFDGTDPDCDQGSPAHCGYGGYGTNLSHFVSDETTYHAGTFADDLAGEDGLRGFCDNDDSPCRSWEDCGAGNNCDEATYCAMIRLMDDDGEWTTNNVNISEFDVVAYNGRKYTVSTTGVNAVCASGDDVGNTCYHLSGTEECAGAAACDPNCCADGNADGVADNACKDLAFALKYCIQSLDNHTGEGEGAHEGAGTIVEMETGVTHTFGRVTNTGSVSGGYSARAFGDEGYESGFDWSISAGGPSVRRCNSHWGELCDDDGDCTSGTCATATRHRMGFPNKVWIKSDVEGTQAVLRADTNVSGFSTWGFIDAGYNGDYNGEVRMQDVIFQDINFQGDPSCCTSSCASTGVAADKRCPVCDDASSNAGAWCDDNGDCTGGDCDTTNEYACCDDSSVGCCWSPDAVDDQQDWYQLKGEFVKDADRNSFVNVEFNNYALNWGASDPGSAGGYSEGQDATLFWNTTFDNLPEVQGPSNFGQNTVFDGELITLGWADWFTWVNVDAYNFENLTSYTDSDTTVYRGHHFQECLIRRGTKHGIRPFGDLEGLTLLGNIHDISPGFLEVNESSTVGCDVKYVSMENNSVFYSQLGFDFSKQALDAEYFTFVNNMCLHPSRATAQNGKPCLIVPDAAITGTTRTLIDYNFWERIDVDEILVNFDNTDISQCDTADPKLCYCTTAQAAECRGWSTWTGLGYDTNSNDPASVFDPLITVQPNDADTGIATGVDASVEGNYLPQESSPLIDAGHPAYAVPVSDEVSGIIDVGAVEFPQAAPVVDPTPAPAPSQAGRGGRVKRSSIESESKLVPVGF